MAEGGGDISSVIVSERLNKHGAGNQYPGRDNADSESIDAEAAEAHPWEVQDSGTRFRLQLVDGPNATGRWQPTETWRLFAGEDGHPEEAELGAS